MEGSHIKNIDFQNISGQSLGEVDPDARLKAIEKKVKETFAFTKKYKEKGKRLPFDKLLPFLNNINAVSQHNYNVSQNLLLQNRHLQEALYRVNEDLKHSLDESDDLKATIEENTQKFLAETKSLSNEIEKLNSFVSNYRLENDMLKDIIKEKSEIISQKEEVCQRLSDEVQQLSTKLKENQAQNTEKIQEFITKDSENQQQMHIFTLNLNTKDSEIANLRALHHQEKESLEKEIKQLRNDLQKISIEREIQSQKAEKIEKEYIVFQKDHENLQKIFKETEKKLSTCEKELVKTKETVHIKEKETVKELEVRIETIRGENIEKIVALEAKAAQFSGQNEEFSKKIAELLKENQGLKVKLEQEIEEKREFEIAVAGSLKEKEKLLNDFTEVKKRYESLVDELERDLKASKIKLWEYENICDGYKNEINRLKEKEILLNKLSKFDHKQLNSYLKLNIHFNDAYQDIMPENLDKTSKQAEKEMEMFKKTAEFKIIENSKQENNAEDPLAFNDLDKEWDLVNAAISNLNDKYKENLNFLDHDII